MRVVFFGTSNYCLPVLEALKDHFDLVLVVTREDKPVGRKQVLTPSATKVWAKEHGIETASSLPPRKDIDLAIVADFGKIIPEREFNLPKLGTFNIHFSRLPDLRGASPVQSALLRGDTSAWITIFKLEKTLDTGPLLWQKEYPIFLTETAGQLYTRLFGEVAKELPTIDFKGVLTLQDHSRATYSKLLTKQDGFVGWEDVDKVGTYNRFRAMTPWPGLWSVHPNGKRVNILNCHRENDKLVLDEIQFEGRKLQKFSGTLFP